MSSFISNAFMLPNDLIDKGYMADMKGPALPCYLFIVRKTRGWNKTNDSISLSQLIEGTGYGRDAVLSGVDKLVSMGVIERKSFANQPAKYVLTDSIFAVGNNDGDKSAVGNIDGGVGNNDGTQSEITTHNNNSKTTNTKTNINTCVKEKVVSEKPNKFDFKSALINNGVSEKTATEFMQVRKAKGGVNTERAFTLLEKQIAKANLSFSDGVEYCLNRQKPWAAFEAQWYFNEVNQTAQSSSQQQPQRRRFGNQANQNEMRTVGGQTQ